ncbi:MAG: alpha/beta fold hydrolase [Pseudomonadota bacterium]
MPAPETFALGTLTLQSGETVPDAQITYATYGTLNADRSNAILYPTSYGAHHGDIDWLIGPGRVLDPDGWFIVIPNQFGNGLSSSPSNLAAPHPRPAFGHWDNVHAQERLLREVFGITRLALIYGWSMGGQQALHWGALFPDRVARICATCTSARTTPHNKVFLDGLRSALMADPAWQDGRFIAHPERGLTAFARIYAGWAMSQAFYREELWRSIGFTALEDYIKTAWEGRFMHRDPHDLLSMLDTWTRSDIADNDVFKGDLGGALGAIRARTIILPSVTDLYFTADDSAIEVPQMPDAELRPIQSIWGHRAGNPVEQPADEAVLRQAVADLLAD